MITNEDALDIFSRRDDELDSASAEKILLRNWLVNTPHFFESVASTANHASEAISTPPMSREGRRKAGGFPLSHVQLVRRVVGGFHCNKRAYGALDRDGRHKKSRWAYFVARHAPGTGTFRIISWKLGKGLRTHGANLGVRTYYVVRTCTSMYLGRYRTVRRPDGRQAVISCPSPHFTSQCHNTRTCSGSIDALHVCISRRHQQNISDGPIKSTLCVSRGSRRSPCTLFGCILFGSKCRQSRRRHPSPTSATSTCVTTSRREQKEKQACKHPKSSNWRYSLRHICG